MPDKSKIYEGTFLLIYKKEVEGRKTPILEIINWDDINLGEIKWYPAWRKFCFYPNKDTVWDNKCLVELINFLNKYNKEWKENVKNIKKDIS